MNYRLKALIYRADRCRFYDKSGFQIDVSGSQVIDNATFHKGGRIEAWRGTRPAELIEQAGCKVLYLPPYSPDLN